MVCRQHASQTGVICAGLRVRVLRVWDLRAFLRDGLVRGGCRGGRSGRPPSVSNYSRKVFCRWVGLRLVSNRFRCRGVRAPRTGAPTFCVPGFTGGFCVRGFCGGRVCGVGVCGRGFAWVGFAGGVAGWFFGGGNKKMLIVVNFVLGCDFLFYLCSALSLRNLTHLYQ